MKKKCSETIHIDTPVIPTSFAEVHQVIAAGPKTYPKHEPFIDALHDAIFITDTNGIIIDSNIRARDFFNVEDGIRLLGLPVYVLFSGDYNRIIREIRTNIKIYPFVILECRAVRFDKSSFDAEISVSRSAIEKHNYIFSVRNITKRSDAIHSLETAIERLQDQDRERMAFISNISHELRTPLTSMVYAVNNMLRGVCGPVPPKAVVYLEHIKADETRLMNTINDILDMRQIETHSLVLTKTEVGLNDLLLSVIDALSIQATAKQQKIKANYPKHETFILADRHKLERVFFNILNNAIKFTPSGGTIQCFILPDADNTSLCHIVFNDTGTGILPKDLPKIGRRYYRVGKHIEGTGLGLSIAKDTVELHGGTIIVRSPVPETSTGTQVDLTFTTCSGPTIYVSTTTPRTHKYLNHYDYTIIDTPSEKMKLAVFDENIPDLDAQIKAVHSYTPTPSIPIILLCSVVLPKYRTYIRNGVEILCIDITESRFIDTVRRLISGKV